MAICDFCEQEMSDHTPDNGCKWEFLEYSDGTVLPRTKHHFEERTGYCHDCNALHGNYHHPGCDVERCPRCSGQLISCGCDVSNVVRYRKES